MAKIRQLALAAGAAVTLASCGPQGGLDALYALSCAALPGARPGVGAGAVQSSKSA